MVPLSRSCNLLTVPEYDFDFPAMPFCLRVVCVLVLAVALKILHKEDCLGRLKFHISARLVKRVFRWEKAEVIVVGREIRDVTLQPSAIEAADDNLVRPVQFHCDLQNRN